MQSPAGQKPRLWKLLACSCILKKAWSFPRGNGRPAAFRCAARKQERVLDPLEEALTDTWGDPEEGQWGYEYPSEAEFLDTVYQDQGTSEELTQGIVALALTGLIVAATTTILWRILIVTWALVAAAVRYSIVAVFLILIAAFLT